jgi:hypothetical protein
MAYSQIPIKKKKAHVPLRPSFFFVRIGGGGRAIGCYVDRWPYRLVSLALVALSSRFLPQSFLVRLETTVNINGRREENNKKKDSEGWCRVEYSHFGLLVFASSFCFLSIESFFDL